MGKYAKGVGRALAVAGAVAFLLAFNAANATAASILGEVVGLADGDTVTVLDSAKMQHKVRLLGIDAPEKNQAFGERSRQHLAALVFRKQVIVEWTKTDRYRRIVGKVLVGDVDAGLEQIRAGLAWHYKAYDKEQSAADRIAYARAEEQAREEVRGLWRDDAPVPPWSFRRPRGNMADQSRTVASGRNSVSGALGKAMNP